MKYKFLILIIFLIPIVKVEANETENLLNSISKKIQSMKTEVNKLDLLKKYPVGSIYISTNSTNPSSLFGGTWQSFGQGRTLIGAGSNGTTNYTNGSSGGSSKTTISISNVPSHTHTITAKGSVSSTFTGNSVSTSSSGSHLHLHHIFPCGDEVKGYGIYALDKGFAGRVILMMPDKIVTYSSSASGHTHSITPQGTVSSRFSGTKANTSSVGASSSISVQNPYIVTYIWKRIA